MCAEFKIVVFTRNTLSRLTAPVPPPIVFIHLISHSWRGWAYLILSGVFGPPIRAFSPLNFQRWLLCSFIFVFLSIIFRSENKVLNPNLDMWIAYITPLRNTSF